MRLTVSTAVGTLDVTIVTLVGHTPGSIAAIFRDPDGSTHLFTGDSLFPGGVGNTRHDPAAFASLMGDVTINLFAKLPDATHVYPGHGAAPTPGAARPTPPRGPRAVRPVHPPPGPPRDVSYPDAAPAPMAPLRRGIGRTPRITHSCAE